MKLPGALPAFPDRAALLLPPSHLSSLLQDILFMERRGDRFIVDLCLHVSGGAGGAAWRGGAGPLPAQCGAVDHMHSSCC
jgi:hypothetical protein